MKKTKYSTPEYKAKLGPTLIIIGIIFYGIFLVFPTCFLIYYLIKRPNILDILQKYSDEEHRLSQKDIQDILKKEYEMPVDRKAVKRNLLNLIEYGSNIEYREVARKDIFN